MWIEAISGLKINLEESELSLMGSVPYVEDLVAELGCRQRDLPTFYLGLSFGEPFKSRVGWHLVEERVHKRLAMWKQLYLSKGGRLILIKSAQSSLHILKFLFLSCL